MSDEINIAQILAFCQEKLEKAKQLGNQETIDTLNDLCAMLGLKKKEAYWIPQPLNGTIKCSHCGEWERTSGLIHNNYCPNCGYKIVERPMPEVTGTWEFVGEDYSRVVFKCSQCNNILIVEKGDDCEDLYNNGRECGCGSFNMKKVGKSS